MIIVLSCYRHALISSKTKDSRKVYTLHLDREALLSRSNSDSNWKVKVCLAVYLFLTAMLSLVLISLVSYITF